jgi:hypothetical protein
VLIADVTLTITIVGTRFSVLGLQSSDARRWVCEVVARASRTRCGGMTFGSEGLQGLCQMREPSYLLVVDDCDDVVFVVMMVVAKGSYHGHCHSYNHAVLTLFQCIAKPMA